MTSHYSCSSHFNSPLLWSSLLSSTCCRVGRLFVQNNKSGFGSSLEIFLQALRLRWRFRWEVADVSSAGGPLLLRWCSARRRLEPRPLSRCATPPPMMSPPAFPFDPPLWTTRRSTHFHTYSTRRLFSGSKNHDDELEYDQSLKRWRSSCEDFVSPYAAIIICFTNNNVGFVLPAQVEHKHLQMIKKRLLKRLEVLPRRPLALTSRLISLYLLLCAF